MKQVNTSVCMGMGAVGKARLKLYRERTKAQGYKTLSAYIVNLVDSELRLKIPYGRRHRSNVVQIVASL